tara:strand:+ start:428 stop:910 length:483 start_codon:yes stop_codon:yes gene_type:complete
MTVFIIQTFTPLLQRALGDLPQIPCWAPLPQIPCWGPEKQKKAKKAKKEKKGSPANRTREEAIAAGGNRTNKPIYHWGKGGPKEGQQYCAACTEFGRHKCGGCGGASAGNMAMWNSLCLLNRECGGMTMQPRNMNGSKLNERELGNWEDFGQLPKRIQDK